MLLLSDSAGSYYRYIGIWRVGVSTNVLLTTHIPYVQGYVQGMYRGYVQGMYRGYLQRYVQGGIYSRVQGCMCPF
jgi:hypothetical protein